MREIDQSIVLTIVNPVDDQLLPYQRAPVVEDFLTVLVEVDIADGDRPRLPPEVIALSAGPMKREVQGV